MITLLASEWLGWFCAGLCFAVVLAYVAFVWLRLCYVRLELAFLQRKLDMAKALATVRLIEELRTGLAESVTIYQPNDDFTGPAEGVCINGEWTDFEDREFFADTLLEALTNATEAKRQWQATQPQS